MMIKRRKILKTNIMVLKCVWVLIPNNGPNKYTNEEVRMFENEKM